MRAVHAEGIQMLSVRVFARARANVCMALHLPLKYTMTKVGNLGCHFQIWHESTKASCASI